MHIGNLLPVEGLLSPVMATTSARFGIRHLTVVPANYEPDTEADPEGEGDETTAA